MVYKWHGDVNPKCGGMFLDFEEFAKWEDYIPCIKITDLDSGIGFEGAVLIEYGSIYIPKDPEKRKNALSVLGEEKNPAPSPLMLAEAFDAYGGIDRDTWRGLLTVQTLKEGAMEFNGWKADKKVDDLKKFIEEEYNVQF